MAPPDPSAPTGQVPSTLEGDKHWLLPTSLGYSSLIPLLGSDPLTKRVEKRGPRIQGPLISAQGLGSLPAHPCPALPGNHTHLELSSNLGTVATTPSRRLPQQAWPGEAPEGVNCCAGPPFAGDVGLGGLEWEHGRSRHQWRPRREE